MKGQLRQPQARSSPYMSEEVAFLSISVSACQRSSSITGRRFLFIYFCRCCLFSIDLPFGDENLDVAFLL